MIIIITLNDQGIMIIMVDKLHAYGRDYEVPGLI